MFVIICGKCCDNSDRIFQGEEIIVIVKILALIEQKFYVYLINMLNKKISQEFRFKNTDETKNYLIEEIKQNDLMIKKL